MNLFQTDPRGVEAIHLATVLGRYLRFRRTLVGLKRHLRILLGKEQLGFRRTLVGLKRLAQGSPRQSRERFRRTLVGLKRIASVGPCTVDYRFRRTLVGLKRVGGDIARLQREFQTDPRGVEAAAHHAYRWRTVSFRRTLVGLKRSGFLRATTAACCFRRTLVGLKPRPPALFEVVKDLFQTDPRGVEALTRPT